MDCASPHTVANASPPAGDTLTSRAASVSPHRVELVTHRDRGTHHVIALSEVTSRSTLVTAHPNPLDDAPIAVDLRGASGAMPDRCRGPSRSVR